MAQRRPRHLLVPNANNPRLLTRLVRLVASGIRRPRALAEVLGVEVRTVNYYTQAGEWVGLLEPGDPIRLSPRGLEVAYAEGRSRTEAYARALWSTPAAKELGLVPGAQLDTATVQAWIQATEPELSAATAVRRASAVRGLIAPTVGLALAPDRAQKQQLGLPFPDLAHQGRIQAPAPRGPVSLTAGTDENPDIYARVLEALLDHGELSTGQLRAELDGMGAGGASLGGVFALGERRRDVTRADDRIVATAGAVARRALFEDAVLLAFTDPEYRRWLDRARQGGPPDAAARAASTRFARWDKRIFGARLDLDTAGRTQDARLHGRRVDGLPVACDAGPPLAVTDRPFTECLDTVGLPLCLPSSVVQLGGGVSRINRHLDALRRAPTKVRPADIVAPRAVVHGGLAHPKEGLLRAVPDTHSLRARALTHVPALSLLASLLLLGRRHDADARVRRPDTHPTVHWAGLPRGTLITVLEEFSAHQGWICLRPASGGLTSTALVATAVSLGVATQVADQLVLDERLFTAMCEDPETVLVQEALDPLVDRWQAWLESEEAAS